MQKLNIERSSLDKVVSSWKQLYTQIEDSEVLLDMAMDERDEASFIEVDSEIKIIESKAESLEVQSLLSGDLDSCSTYMSINSGAGGTEACDWAQMLFRMFSRYAERSGFKVEILAMTEGDEVGIKSVSFSVEGPYAYGLLRAEAGVHRLVRISPFDSNAKRHTSFASVFAWPVIDDNVNIEIKPDDLRIDTYRSGGKGGQHVNKTDSAVRLTHIPTNTVVQCQSGRSQIQNKETAMKMLKAALYEQEMERRQKEKDAVNSNKKANEWGSQIRSYVLAPYQMVKDHRTQVESSNPDAVLDGGLKKFIENYLKYKAQQSIEKV